MQAFTHYMNRELTNEQFLAEEHANHALAFKLWHTCQHSPVNRWTNFIRRMIWLCKKVGHNIKINKAHLKFENKQFNWLPRCSIQTSMDVYVQMMIFEGRP